jgi:UDP-N-acetylmuramoylalanine--D-glutamate ligase
MLAALGEEVIGVDSGSPAGAEGLAGPGVEISLDDDGLTHLDRARCLVKSPGVPSDAPVVAAARDRGTPVLG